MRLVFLPSSYFPESLGGTETYVHHLAEALTQRGHEVAVVCHRPPAADTGVRYRVVDLPPRRVPRRAELYRGALGEEPIGFAALLADWQPDLVHFHALTLGAGLDHARCARRAGIPYLVTYHTPTFSCRKGTLLRWGRQICDGVIEPGRCSACLLHGRGWPRPLAQALAHSPLPHRALPEGAWLTHLTLPALLRDAHVCWQEFMHGAAAVVACAAWCRDLLLANGVPPAYLTLLRQALPGTGRQRRLRLPLAPRAGAPFRLGFFGRFTPVKGPDLLVQAVAQLRRQGIAVTAELAGPIDPSEQHWAERCCAMTPHARHVGVKRGEELAAWLRSLDLIVVPSRCLETGPLTLLEAWDEGVPVIGADLGGIREFLRAADLEALLFAPDSPAALAAAVQRCAAWAGTPQPVVWIDGMAELAERMEGLYRNACAAGTPAC
jgi:glycosyltransferase involved in cell wall biosynthesis